MWPAIIAGGALLGSALIGRSGQQDTNVANAQQAQAQMDFQREMANTAHQRQVADLRAAGLNPILSGTGGAGASSPQGAMARMENPNAGLADAASSAFHARNMIAQTKNLAADTKLKIMQENATREVKHKTYQEKLNLEEILKQERATTQLLRNQIPGSRIEHDIDEAGIGGWTRNLNRIIPFLGSGSSAFRNFRPR